MSDTIERMTGVFREVLDDPAITLMPETTAADIEDWDSLSHINLVVAVEDDFGVNFTTREIASLANVGEMVALIDSKLNQ